MSPDSHRVELSAGTAPGPGAPIGFSGRVLDANAMQQGQLTPLVGVTVSFLGSGVSATSDADGYFSLSEDVGVGPT